MNWEFYLMALGLGVSLAMDAFSVSLANGLAEPKMKKRKVLLIAGMFAFFQFLMPMLGWLCVHFVVQLAEAFTKIVPWISLGLLGFIGGKMLIEGIHHKDGDEVKPAVGFGALVVQGVATSIDALSVGFTISDYEWNEALLTGGLIAAVTLVICTAGVLLGKTFGTRLAGKASVFGGAILITIGIWIFVKGVFGIDL